MSEKKRLNRRSFLGRVAGSAALVGSASALVTGEAAAQNQTGRTDSDSGNGADRPGYGRTGLTDSDSGNGADRPGYGRRGSGGTGITDRDPTDASGNGRGTGVTDSDPTDASGAGRGGSRSGLTDSDSGTNADRAGNGRGATRSSPSGVTDGDSGSYADRANYGRGPRRNW